MADPKGDTEPTLVERWLQEQQEWQRTLLTYVDSMVKNDEFLVNLGNAMRGSLLAGKPYPTAQAASQPTPTDERLDQVLFALNALQGQLHDLFMSIEEIRRAGKPPGRALRAAPTTPVAPTQAAARRGTRKTTPRQSARKRKARA